MLDTKVIQENPERVKTSMQNKGNARTDLVDKALTLDEQRRKSVTQLQKLQTESNAISKQIGELMKEGRKADADVAIRESAETKERLKQLEAEVGQIDDALEQVLLQIPNIHHESVPVGAKPSDNAVVSNTGVMPEFEFEPLSHWELAAKHELIDFDRGAKVSGAGFPFYVGKGAKLQRALIQFYLDTATSAGGYTEIQPPVVVNAASARGTGQLPDKDDQMYVATRDELYLIPTGEVPVTNFHRDEILDRELPLKYCAYTPCFRREAGSYGKDVRGLNRLHQFDKVEIVQLVEANKSYEALEELRQDAERPLQLLGLPYRTLMLCTGDMGFTQSKTYDLEVWSAGQERWLEVSSISNFESFQARRMNIRHRGEDGKPDFVHTLNASALALPRTMASLLENNQQSDGSILIPSILHRYTGFEIMG